MKAAKNLGFQRCSRNVNCDKDETYANKFMNLRYRSETFVVESLFKSVIFYISFREELQKDNSFEFLFLHLTLLIASLHHRTTTTF